MAWNPYTDRQNRGYSNILTSLFPKQTKTLPRIIVWSFLFLLDLMIVSLVCSHFAMAYSKWMLTLVFLFALAVFWLEGWLWGILARFFCRIFPANRQ